MIIEDIEFPEHQTAELIGGTEGVVWNVDTERLELWHEGKVKGHAYKTAPGLKTWIDFMASSWLEYAKSWTDSSGTMRRADDDNTMCPAKF